MKKNLSILFSIIILSAAIGMSIRFVFAQIGWEEPANTPPIDSEIPLWIKNGNDLYHTTGGNVGIGTTSPASKLEVVNSSGASDVYGIKTAASSTYGGYERIYGIYSSATAATYSGGDFTVGVYGGATSTRGLPVGVYGSGGIRGRGVQGTGKVGVYGYAYGIAGSTGVFAWGDIYGLEAAGDYAVYAMGNTYGIFSDSGKNYFSDKVSIGTTSSASTLSLTGNVSIDYPTITAPPGGMIVAGNVGIGTTSPSQKLQVAGSAVIDGSVGIGTTSPIGKVHIFAGGAGGAGWSTGLNIGDATNYTGFIQDGGVSRWRNFGTGGYDWRNSAAASIMVWTDTGRVGIGMTNPGATLDVAGDVKTTGQLKIGNHIYINDPFLNANFIFVCSNQATWTDTTYCGWKYTDSKGTIHYKSGTYGSGRPSICGGSFTLTTLPSIANMQTIVDSMTPPLTNGLLSKNFVISITQTLPTTTGVDYCGGGGTDGITGTVNINFQQPYIDIK